jgi:hypothetical protein
MEQSIKESQQRLDQRLIAQGFDITVQLVVHKSKGWFNQPLS